MSGNTTYYVDINSQYRDVEKYPNSTDFAVSFSSNTQTGFFPQGLPLSPSGYFQQASIDPDFVDDDLKFITCQINQYRRIENTIFVCGTYDAFRSPSPRIKYKNTVIYNLKTVGNIVPTFNLQNIIFIARIDIVEEEIPYVVRWNIYTDPTTVYTNLNNSDGCNFNITNDNNIYYTILYPNPFNLNKQDEDNDISTVISNIQPLYGADRTDYRSSAYTFLLDFDGNLGLYNGHNWGYHVFGSDVAEVYRTISPGVDNGKNLYSNSFFLNFNFSVYKTDTKYINPSYAYFGRDMYIYTGANNQKMILQHAAFSTNASLSPINPALSTGCFFMSSDSFTGIYYINKQFVNTPSNITSIGYADFCEANNNLYAVKNYFTSYTGAPLAPTTGGVINPDLPIQYYIYDKTGHIFNYITETSPGSYNGNMYPHSVSYNNNVYTFGRASFTGSDNSSLLYCYKFNTTTNTVSKVATIGFTGSYFTNSKVYSLVDGSYIYILCSDYDRFNPSNDSIVKGYVVRFDPATNNVIQYSEYDVLAATTYIQNILVKGAEKYLLTSYTSNSDTDFYNITDLSNISSTYFITSAPYTTPVPFRIKTKEGLYNYFLFSININTLNAMWWSIDNIADMRAIRRFGGNQPIPYIDENGYGYFLLNFSSPSLYIFTTSYVVPPFDRGLFPGRVKICGELYADSVHYNQNISSTINVSTGANCIDYFYHTYSEHNILGVASQNYMQFYILNSNVSLTTYNQYTTSLSSIPNVLKSIEFNNQRWIFICESNKCLVYTVDLLSTFNFVYKETITTTWNIVDLNIIDKGGSLVLVLYSSSCDMNVYQNSTSFNFIASYNYSSGTYNQYANSYIFYRATDTTYYIMLLINNTPLINNSNVFMLNINNLSSFVTKYNNAYGTPAGQGYKSTSFARFQGTDVLSNYFSDSNLQSLINLTDLDRIFVEGIVRNKGSIDIGEYNGTPCTSFFTLNNILYLICNRSNPGDSTEYLACYSMFVPPGLSRFSGTNIFYYTVTLESSCIDLKSITIGSKSFSISLLSNNKIYLYDLSDPSFAGQNQQQTTISRRYQDGNFFGIQNLITNNFIYKVNADGTPDWATYVGNTLNSFDKIGETVNIRDNLVLDSSQQNIYIAGTFRSRVQTHNYTSTGYYLSQQITNINDIFGLTSSFSGFILKINVLSGNSIYMIPHFGLQESTFRNISYIPNEDAIVVCGDFTSNISTIYGIQPAGTFTNPIISQKVMNRVSLGTGFLAKFNSSGTLQWANILFTDDAGKSILSRYVTANNNKITVLGSSTTNTMKCLLNNGTVTQTLYSSLQGDNNNNLYFYCFKPDGTYIQSNNIIVNNVSFLSDPIFLAFWVVPIYQNQTENEIVFLPNVNSASALGTIIEYNKDGTLANTTNFSDAFPVDSCRIVRYKYDSTYYSENGLPYSQIVFNQNTPYPFTGGYFDNYYLYIGGNPNSTGINNTFTIRDNFTGTNNKPSIILNSSIDISSLDRNFNTINNISNSNNYYFTNVSKSPLSSVIEYDRTNINTGSNQITVLRSFNQIDPNKFYYITYPYNGFSNKIIPVTNILDIGDGEYIFTIQYTDDLQNPTGGAYYGPYLYLSAFNQSLYYNLQFFPGSIAQPVYYNVRLQSMTVPNRPLLNLQEYGGNMNFNDLPFMYLSLYNVDDNDNYDNQVVNVVYDSTPLNVEPYPVFQIPITNPGTLNNFLTLSSDMQPVVKFSPGYYNIRVRLLDMNGNPILLDQSKTKSTDSKFIGGSLPSYLTSVYLRLAFTKRG